jgi:hypothetical protein
MKVKSEEEIQEIASQWMKDNKDADDARESGFIEGYNRAVKDQAALIECLEQKITMMQRVFDGIAHFTKR